MAFAVDRVGGPALLLLVAATMPASNALAQKSAEDAARETIVAPAEDVNLAKKKIPPVLEKIENNPYARDATANCAAIAAAVAELNDALGPDFDDPPPPETSDEARAVSAVGSAALSLIPARGLIREVSGANKAEARHARAIQAGIARRAYLKGVGAQLKCKGPAAPRR